MFIESSRAIRTRALAPAALFPAQLASAAFGSSTCEEDITFAAFNKSPSFCFLCVRAETRTLQGRKPSLRAFAAGGGAR